MSRLRTKEINDLTLYLIPTAYSLSGGLLRAGIKPRSPASKDPYQEHHLRQDNMNNLPPEFRRCSLGLYLSAVCGPSVDYMISTHISKGRFFVKFIDSTTVFLQNKFHRHTQK